MTNYLKPIWKRLKKFDAIGSVQPCKDQMVPSYKSASCMQV